MIPHLFKIGPITVHSFGFALAVGFLLIAWLVSKDFKRRGYSPDLGGTTTLAAMVGGVLGAKLYYLLDHWPSTVADPVGSIFSGSGLTYYGGFIGGFIAVVVVARRHGIAFREMGDICAPLLGLGYGVGRLGCFLNGDDYGRVTDSWIGMAFPKGQPPTAPGVTVIPTQAFEAAAGLALFALLWKLRVPFQETRGRLFGTYLVLAGIERFAVEFWRTNDPIGLFTVAQWISLGLVALGTFLLLTSSKR